MTADRVLCERETVAPVAVRYIERESGPGVTLYACPDCAPHLAPGPLPAEAPRLLRS